jgi:hypothetical protein
MTKVITHKIYTDNCSITRQTGLIPTDGMQRITVTVKIDDDRLNTGRSLTAAMKPVTYSDKGRRLKWWEIASKTTNELDLDWARAQPFPFASFGAGEPSIFAEVAL